MYFVLTFYSASFLISYKIAPFLDPAVKYKVRQFLSMDIKVKSIRQTFVNSLPVFFQLLGKFLGVELRRKNKDIFFRRHGKRGLFKIVFNAVSGHVFASFQIVSCETL